MLAILIHKRSPDTLIVKDKAFNNLWYIDKNGTLFSDDMDGSHQ